MGFKPRNRKTYIAVFGNGAEYLSILWWAVIRNIKLIVLKDDQDKDYGGENQNAETIENVKPLPKLPLDI